MKILKAIFALGFIVWACGFCGLIVIPNIMVTAVANQAPFGGDQIRAWQLGTPQPIDSELASGWDSSAAGPSMVPRDGYRGPSSLSERKTDLHTKLVRRWFFAPLMGICLV